MENKTEIEHKKLERAILRCEGSQAPTLQEMRFVDHLVGTELSPLKQFKIKTAKDKAGNEYTIGRFLQNETGRLAMTIIAIYNLYVKDHQYIYFDEQLTAYVLPDVDYIIDNPETYIKTNFENYKNEKAIAEIVRYIEWRWSTSKVNAQNVRTTISDYLMTSLKIDPFWVAIEKAVKKMLNGATGWTPVHYTAFEEALSEGIEKENYEPYRNKVFEYLLKAPLVLHWQKADGSPAYTGQGIQAMPIIYGKQGLGKSTLVQKLGLEWADSIKNIADQTQENIYKRAMNVILDYGELSGMKKSELVDLKSALTQRFLTFNPKYSNGIMSLPANALIVGTTNEADLLKDLTGERRFWPIAINHYDYDKVDFRFILRAYATEYLTLKEQFDGALKQPSLNLVEDDEERRYKEENYGQADSSIDVVEDFLRDVIQKDEYLNTLYYSKHADCYCFAVKATIEAGFTRWQAQNNYNAKTIYPSKATSYLLGLPNVKNGKRFKTNGKIIRGIMVPTSILNKKLGL